MTNPTRFTAGARKIFDTKDRIESFCELLDMANAAGFRALEYQGVIWVKMGVDQVDWARTVFTVDDFSF